MASETPPSWLVESDLWQVTSGGFFLQGRSGQLRGVPQRTRIRVAAWRYIPWMVFAETAPPPPTSVGRTGRDVVRGARGARGETVGARNVNQGVSE